jgi:hypothetical protein
VGDKFAHRFSKAGAQGNIADRMLQKRAFFLKSAEAA